MNKAVIGTVAGVVLGAASGYIVADKASEKEVKSLSETIESHQRAPRFGVQTPTGGEAVAVVEKTHQKVDFDSIMKERNVSKKVNQLIEYYGSLTPDELAVEAKKLANMSWEDRLVAGNLLFSKWAEVSPKQAMEFANKLGPRAMMEKSAVLQTWSAKNPEEAAAYYMDNKNILNGRSAGIIAGEWARLDPDAALAWANGLNAQEKGGALRSALGAFAEIDPAMAAQKAASLSAEDLANSGVLDSIASQWAKKDWAATESWLNSLPADLQAAARQHAVEGLATVNPSLAAEQISRMADGNEKESAVASVARAMALENPAQAADLVLKNSAGNNMRTSMALGEVMGSWLYSDTAAAKKWTNSLPTGDTKNAALVAYAMQTPSTDYAETINMVSGINNDRLKEFATGAAVRNWMKEDPTAANQWIESSNLSDRAKRAINDPGPMRFIMDGGNPGGGGLRGMAIPGGGGGGGRRGGGGR